ncbi:MAG: CHAT domain-containing protein [Pyrinomonadaceae bacterium]
MKLLREILMAGTTLEFHFLAQKKVSRAKRLWSWLFGSDAGFSELKRSYVVRFRSGDDQSEAEPSWGDDSATKQLEAGLARMLTAEMSREQASWMADRLHGFLFANNRLDVHFDRAMPGLTESMTQTEIQIHADDASIALLTNLPWELTRDVIASEQGDQRLLLGTLAPRPIVRTIPAAVAPRVQEERLRVLCCIANYKGDVMQFDAPAFERAIEESIGSQPATFAFVTAPDYQPRVAQVYAEIDKARPHVFIFVGHGRSRTGTPELRLEQWIKVEEVARNLAQAGTLLAILIACDQSRLIQSPAAQSGALTLLNNGVPAAVAMQGYVEPTRAQAFLSSFITNLFVTHSVSRAAAQGRVAMDRTPRNESWTSDWVLPAVFRRGSLESERDQLSLILGHHQPAMERLLSFVPPVGIHLARPTLEESLLDLLNDKTGLLAIDGGIGNGRTQLVRAVALARIREAIQKRTPLPRPIFYVDLDEGQSAGVEAWFLAKLRSRLEQVHSLLNSSTLTAVLSTTLATAENAGVLISELDRSRIVLVIDHLRVDAGGFWAELLNQAARMQNSLIVAVGAPGESLPENVDRLQVPLFSLHETKAYVKNFVKDDMALAEAWHESSGGTPLLLDGLRALDKSSVLRLTGDVALRKQGSVSARYIQLISEALDPAEFAALCVFWWFPGLIGTDVACRFIPQDDSFETLNSLVEKGVLTRVQRLDKELLSLARLKADGLDDEHVDAAAQILTGRFDQEVVVVDFQKGVNELVVQPGGMVLLSGVQAAYMAQGDYETALDLATLLTLPLQEQEFELYKFFNAVLEKKPEIEILDFVWVEAAGLARRVGELDKAEWFLLQLKDKEITRYLHASVLNVKATIMKDRGQSKQTVEILGHYDEAIAIARAGIDGTLSEEATPAEWDQLLATLLFNRAAVLQFFANRRDEALQDMQQVRQLERKHNRLVSEAHAMAQEVDIRLSRVAVPTEWAELSALLRPAYVLLSKGLASNDFAYCCYQYARYYRKRPATSEADRSENLRTALKFYEEAASAASQVGDFKRRAAAVRHWVEVYWAQLGLLPATEAVRHLDSLIPSLHGYQRDAYAARILRDTLFLRAKIEIELNGPQSQEFLRAAADAVVAEPLNPAEKREDGWRGIVIFISYLKSLQAAGNRKEAEGFLEDYRELLNHWLGNAAVNQPWETLIKLTEKEKSWET